MLSCTFLATIVPSRPHGLFCYNTHNMGIVRHHPCYANSHSKNHKAYGEIGSADNTQNIYQEHIKRKKKKKKRISSMILCLLDGLDIPG